MEEHDWDRMLFAAGIIAEKERGQKTNTTNATIN
jgi:hypothetical protein